MDEERIELRLLTDPAYAEELEIVAEELIDRYVEDELTQQDRNKLERQFFKSPERREQLRFAMILKRQRAKRAGNRRLLKVYLPVAAAVIVTVGAGIFSWRTLSRASDVERGLIALQTAFKDQRPFEARVSGLKYAPAVQRGGEDKVDYMARDRAEQLLLNSEDTDAEAHHARGVFYLAEHQFDKAIDQLRMALSRDPQNASIVNDLGVALFEKAKSRDASERNELLYDEYNQSLEQFNKALALDNSFLEALFNRALLYESMTLGPRAEEDWRLYLQKDSNSEWADEARQRLKNLEATRQSSSENIEQLHQKFLRDYDANNHEGAWQAITLSSVRIGNALVEKLIDDYLKLVEQGQSREAQQQYERLKYVGDTKQKRSGDHYVSALAQVYRSVSRQKAALLNKARGMMNLGQTQLALPRYNDALKSHTEAKRLFETAGDSPEAMLNDYWIAICRQQLLKNEESTRLLKNLVEICKRKKYSWLAVRALNALAYSQAHLSDFSKAASYSRQAHELAEQAFEGYGNISALCALMQAYLYLGNRRQSLSQAPQVLASGNSSPATKQRWMAYNETAWALSSFGLFAAAKEYQKIALSLAQQLQEPSTESLAHIRLGAMYGKGANYLKAHHQFQEAFRVLERYSGEPFAKQMSAYALLHVGNVHRQEGNFEKAIASFDSCIDLYGKLDLPSYVYQARKGKLLSLVASRDIPATRKELELTVDLYENFRSKITDEGNRTSFFDFENEVFDVAVDFEYSTPEGSARAFEYAERSRARSLLALVNPHNKLFRSVGELRALIHDEVQTVQYSVLEHRVLMWVVSKKDFHSESTAIEASELKQKISTYLQAVQKRDPDQTLRSAKELHSVLLSPIEKYLDKNKQIFIVPDKILVHLSFGALVSPTSGNYVIEDYSVAMSPSTNIFLASTDAAKERAKSPKEEYLLAVGNPAFDRDEFADFAYLPSSGSEVRQISNFYNDKRLLVWKNAVKEIVITEMTKADVIHLASHAITNELSPLRSKLLLAKGTSNKGSVEAKRGVLEASEIYESNLSRTTLVVLSACQTGTGPSFRGEGVMSMARPFLARGVPQVVASLWAVDTDATAELMVNFHRYRTQFSDPAVTALRKAQLEMLRGSRKLYQQPYYWAGFTLIGGYAEAQIEGEGHERKAS